MVVMCSIRNKWITSEDFLLPVINYSTQGSFYERSSELYYLYSIIEPDETNVYSFHSANMICGAHAQSQHLMLVEIIILCHLHDAEDYSNMHQIYPERYLFTQ